MHRRLRRELTILPRSACLCWWWDGCMVPERSVAACSRQDTCQPSPGGAGKLHHQVGVVNAASLSMRLAMSSWTASRPGAIDGKHPLPACVVLEAGAPSSPGTPASGARQPPRCPPIPGRGPAAAHQLLAGDIEVNRGLYLRPERPHHCIGRLRLLHGPRKPIQDIAADCGQNGFTQHVHDYAIRDQVTVSDVGLNRPPERGLVLTCWRSRSPLEMCAMPNRVASRSACVPLPAPGAPISRSRI